MNAQDRFTQLRDLLVERSILSEKDIDRHELEVRRSAKGSLWLRLHEAGALSKKQAETFEQAAQGYVPVEAARMSLQATAPSSASRVGGLKIAKRGASSADVAKPAAATADATPSPLVPEGPKTVPASARRRPEEAPRPSPERPTESASKRFQEYTKLDLPESITPAVPPSVAAPVAKPPESPMPAARRRRSGDSRHGESQTGVKARGRDADSANADSSAAVSSPGGDSTGPPETDAGQRRSATHAAATNIPPDRAAAASREASSSQVPSSDSRVAALLREKTPLRHMGSLVGRRLGKYQVNSQIGRGASGSVFLAHHVVLNMPVAVKVLDPALAGYHPELLKRFMMEARSAARLAHPNIIRVLDCDQIDGFHIIVMEYVDGISVSELIKINGMVTEERALVIVQSVAEGLEAALESGIIHRDIKPANIMVTKNKQFKLADLGLAKRIDDQGEMSDTRPNIGLGTPHFFAPEQAADASSVDHRSDIYSLGATLFNMLTGQVPFKGKSLPDLIRKHTEEPLVPPNQVVPTVSRLTSELTVHMMAKKPEDRPRNYSDLLMAIQACIINLKSHPGGDHPSRTPSFVRDLFTNLFAKKP